MPGPAPLVLFLRMRMRAASAAAGLCSSYDYCRTLFLRGNEPIVRCARAGTFAALPTADSCQGMPVVQDLPLDVSRISVLRLPEGLLAAVRDGPVRPRRNAERVRSACHDLEHDTALSGRDSAPGSPLPLPRLEYGTRIDY
jgi:hypothetical protein